MKKQIYKIRSSITKKIKSKSRYFLATKSLKPLSRKFGFDRGTPIDRFWIESFLKENRRQIKGKCLEITDNFYIKKFGLSKVKTRDVLDIDIKNKKANIHGDLRNLKNKIKDNSYDCVILTHVLGAIDEYEKALLEIKRILKPGGVLLLTSSCFSPIYIQGPKNYWRFTPDGAKHVFGNIFGERKVKVKSYGNVLTGQCFWVGMSQEELSKYELEYNDPEFPCIVGVLARK
ncbi:class I SAM-dependent methyltransferase [Candidatus Woesebacteria bacterium]|nr:class I SAM-dependent methyltransferase [Candidatus Woesebacteria bacterium]QQG47190.1 MAG: class I SAM-dependent methyltransferase [Candidatus Woesebacteria bacterium]